MAVGPRVRIEPSQSSWSYKSSKCMSFRLSIRGKGTTSISKDQSKVFLGCKAKGKGTLKVIPLGPAGVVGNSSLYREL